MNIESKLTNLIELSSSVRVYVPSTVDTDVAVDTSEYVTAAQTLLADAFGGATAFAAIGCWVSPHAGLVREAVTIVQAHATEAALFANVDSVLAFAEKMKAELVQDAVAIEINNKLYLV